MLTVLISKDSKKNISAKIQRHSRFLRARTPALWPQYRCPVSYRTEERLNRRAIPSSRSRQTGYQSRSNLSTRKSRSASNGEQKNLRRESMNNKDKDAKTNDIQKILSLDNPDEKIALLLSMLDDKLLKESEKRALDSKVLCCSFSYRYIEVDCRYLVEKCFLILCKFASFSCCRYCLQA